MKRFEQSEVRLLDEVRSCVGRMEVLVGPTVGDPGPMRRRFGLFEKVSSPARVSAMLRGAMGWRRSICRPGGIWRRRAN